MSRVDRLSQREVGERTGLNRRTVGRALSSGAPPSYGPRQRQPSKLDPYRPEIERLLEDNPTLSGVRILEELRAQGFAGGKTILDDHLRDLRPRFAPAPRTYQRTNYLPGELAQIDLMELRKEVPVGYGQTRRAYLLTLELPFSKALAAELIFSKRFEDIGHGVNSCLTRIGALPKKLVLDREGALHKGSGHPTEVFAAYLGQLSLGWIILAPRDAEAKGALERSHRYLHGNFEAARRFANPADLRHQLDLWLTKANNRKHRTTKQVINEHFEAERASMRPLPGSLPGTDHHQVIRIPPQPFLRFDRNDYSLDPRMVGRRVEIRAGQEWVTATELETGRSACRHQRVFAAGRVVTDPAHQAALEEMRATRLGYRPRPKDTEVEIRPLSTYDQLIPA
ncbi:MAG: IS21 family transposase [Thermoleophilia bacterium]|nr:IS21 family transposase [Thermoleophilia bacterium]